MNFKEDGLERKFRTDTVVSDRDSGRVVNRNFRQIYLQFPYFTKELDECSTLSDKLMYALKNMSNWNRMPDALKEQVFEHLARLAAVADLSEENRIAYDKALDRYRVNQIVEEDERRKNEEMRRKAAEEGLKEGMKAGLEKGVKKGRLEGIKEGMKEGMKEGLEKGLEKGEQKKQIEIARKMREDGISIDIIIKYTGLQSSDIENL